METCVHVYVLYLLIGLVAAVEQMVSHRMPVEQLRLGWKIWTVCVVFGSLLGFPLFLITLAAILAVSCALAAFVASIYLLVQFRNAANAYEEAMAHPIEFLPPEE